MSTPKHTPEPWHYNPRKCWWPGVNGAKHRIDTPQEAVFANGGAGPTIALFGNADDPQSMADAKRAADCVNACAGMDDPAAEIARLREIERVARELIAESYTAIGPSHPTRAPYDVAAPGRTWNALRRALTPKEP